MNRSAFQDMNLRSRCSGRSSICNTSNKTTFGNHVVAGGVLYSINTEKGF
jgi:hypothetical protein